MAEATMKNGRLVKTLISLLFCTTFLAVPAGNVYATCDSCKSITSFNFNALSPAVIGVVNESAHTVALTVPFGTDVTSLVPTITLSSGTWVSPPSGVAHNFTAPQTYRATAGDSSFQDYIVTVTVAAAPVQTSASVNTGLGPVNFAINTGFISGLVNLPPASITCSAGGFIFPYGMFSYSITYLTPGATATVTIHTPVAVPMGSKVFKCQNGSLTDFSQYVQQTDPYTFILTLKDGGQGDADGLANGTIVDPCGPAFLDTSNNHRSSPQVPIMDQGPTAIANIAVQSASLSTAKVAPGAPVTVTADVSNQGTADGTAQIKLYVNGQEEANQGVMLSSGSRTPVKFTVSRDEPGTYSVYVGSIPAGTFEVDHFADPNIILYISGALLLLALVIGLIYMTSRKQQAR
jgi:hypothetical protein